VSTDRPEPRYSVFGGPPTQAVEADALEPADLLGCQFGCLVVLAPVWLGIAVGPFGWAVWQHGGLPPLNLITAVPYLFAVIGVGVVLATARAGLLWLADGMVGRLRVEVTPAPLRAGGRHEVRVTPWAGTRLRAVRMELVCRAWTRVEDAEGSETTYRNLAVVPVGESAGPPWVGSVELPADARPTERGAEAGIEWRVRLTGRLFGWWPVARDYDVTVRAAEAG
jgi:hypothetical protein